jgi:hypothetical protein
MKRNNIKFENILLLLWFIVLAWFAFVYATNITLEKKEGFTPKIRSMYRPHLRNARMYYEKFTNHYSSNYFVKILKNIGIY